MANTAQQMTADELASLPDDGNRRELVDGVPHVMPPAGGRHGRVDPQTKSIREYRSPPEIRVDEDGTIDLRDILREFELDVAELYA